MKLVDVLSCLNSLEKNSFLRVVSNIIAEKPKNYAAIDKIIRELDGRLKNADNESIAKIFSLIEEEFALLIRNELTDTSVQLDILIDILIRDGNSLMKREWLLHLYEKELKKLRGRLKDFKEKIESDQEGDRLKSYRIYKACLTTAYWNDEKNNQDKKITKDEQSILGTLAKVLELSQEEVKLIKYLVLPFQKKDIDEIIKYLTKIGVVLYSRKDYRVYVPDEVIRVLRKVRGKEVSDKTFRRVLKQLKDSHINLLARKHNINRNLSRDEKIKEIINEGVSFSSALLNGIHKEGVKKSEKRSFLNALIEKRLKIEEHIRGTSLEAKLKNLIHYLEQKEIEGGASISTSGYNRLLLDLKNTIPRFEKQIRKEFELQETVEISAKNMLNYGINPKDVLYALDEVSIRSFCDKWQISIRGDEILNILNRYKNSEDMYVENYNLIAFRDIHALNEKGVSIKESELGVQFEEVTKIIFKRMGFDVDEILRKRINDSKNRADIVLSLENGDLIIIECKSQKERGFNKYSLVSRQVKAYRQAAEQKGYRVLKIFIVAPDFTDDFVRDCSLDYDLNLSLITASSLMKIYEAYKQSNLKKFPHTLLLRDVLVNEERVINSLLR